MLPQVLLKVARAALTCLVPKLPVSERTLKRRREVVRIMRAFKYVSFLPGYSIFSPWSQEKGSQRGALRIPRCSSKKRECWLLFGCFPSTSHLFLPKSVLSWFYLGFCAYVLLPWVWVMPGLDGFGISFPSASGCSVRSCDCELSVGLSGLPGKTDHSTSRTPFGALLLLTAPSGHCFVRTQCLILSLELRGDNCKDKSKISKKKKW